MSVLLPGFERRLRSGARVPPTANPRPSRGHLNRVPKPDKTRCATPPGDPSLSLFTGESVTLCEGGTHMWGDAIQCLALLWVNIQEKVVLCFEFLPPINNLDF